MQVSFHVRSVSVPEPVSQLAGHETSPVANDAAPRHFKQRSRPRPDGLAVLIETEQLAALEISEIDDEEAEEVAAACLTLAAAHPEAVRRVLFLNQNVRENAVQLLSERAERVPGQQRALASCYLDSGYRLPRSANAAEVLELQQDRQDRDDLHWLGKRNKHGLVDSHGVQERGAYFYQGKAGKSSYSLRDRNCELGSPNGSVFKCRHLQLAAAGSPKLRTKPFLWRISQCDVSMLDYAALEAGYIQQAKQALSINFTPRRFGALLHQLSQQLSVGNSNSYYVGWLANESHAMRVFLQRRHDGRMWAGLYEPGITGNINHISVQPEELIELDFDNLVAIPIEGAPIVLSLAVESRALARACAGNFVDREPQAQFVSLCQALADGNVYEMKVALENLQPGQWPVTYEVAAESLGGAFHHALLNGHAPAVRHFMAVLPELAGFSSSEIAEILAARDERTMPGLHYALAMGHAAAVEAFMTGLPRFSLSAVQTSIIASACDVMSRPGLCLASGSGHAATVARYLAGVRSIFRTGAKLNSFVRYLESELDQNGPITAPDRQATIEALQRGFQTLREDAATLPAPLREGILASPE
ncbi:MAG: hypothetical protein V4684_05495 [Pseudomonadota bacterium]